MLLLVAVLGAAGAAPAQQFIPHKVGGLVAPESLTAQEREVLALAGDFAKRCQDTLEKWISSKEVSEEKLFASLYYPIPRTDPPKFTTDWDRLSDRDIQAIEESVLVRSPAFLFAVLVDRHGYLPTHNTRYSKPLTGDAAVDLASNRTKRMFLDQTGLQAARSTAPFLIQQYQRDTGELLADLSVPVMVRGIHWGAVRIGYRPAEQGAAPAVAPAPAATPAPGAKGN